MRIAEIDPSKAAVEMFACSVCNLNCSYCYIPKNRRMREYNKEIIRKMEDGTFIKELKEVYGENLEIIGLWGTEPTLILDRFSDSIEKYFEAFPRLREIGFSTNSVAHIDRIVDLAKKLDEIGVKLNKQTRLKFQTSIDGPAWVTDRTRGKGKTKIIRDNAVNTILKLRELKPKALTVTYSVKPTVDMEAFAEMNNNTDLIRDWYAFFDDMFKDMRVLEPAQHMNIARTATPTLVVPGKYSKEDGIELAKLFRNLRLIEDSLDLKYITKPINGYVYGLERVIRDASEFRNNPRGMTCGGGDGQLGMSCDGAVTQCHRSFLFEDEEYIEGLLSGTNENNDKTMDEWEISKFDRGIIEKIQKYLCIDNKKASDREKARYVYMLRSYHDNSSFKISYVIAALKELALCGQADEIYLDDDMLCLIFSLFVNSRFSCPIEDYLQTGSLHLTPISIIRLLANGAFTELLMHYFKYIKGRGGN